jgi:hypothetical protein
VDGDGRGDEDPKLTRTPERYADANAFCERMCGHDSKKEQRLTCARAVKLGNLDRPTPADEPIGGDNCD